MAKRHAKEIKNINDINYLLSLSEDDCLTSSIINDMFTDFGDGPRFNTYDYFLVPANSYGSENKKNKKDFYTTVGLWIFNKAFIEKDLFDILGYVSDTYTGKIDGKINTKLSYAVMEDKLSVDALKRFEMKIQKFMPLCNTISPSYTKEMFLSEEKINKKKQQLLKKYDKEIKAENEKVMDQIESELIDYAKEILDGDPSLDMFESGARGSFNNNFKSMFISKGAAKRYSAEGGYDLITSSYMSGISKEDYSKVASAMVAGPYSRAKKTETGGYWEKLFMRAFQHISLLPEGSDCKTKRYLEIELTDKNVDDWMYSYIIDGSRLVELTSENRDKYIGKKVKFRFSAMCESKDGICSKCAGNLFYRLGIKNVGTATPAIPSKVKVLMMKGFHDSTLKFSEMDIEDAFGLK